MRRQITEITPDSIAMRPQRVEAFLRRANVAVLTWINPSGEPMATPIWYRYQDGRFLMHTTLSTAKARAIQGNDRVCLCIQDPEPPYRYVTVRGTARIIGDGARALRLYEEMAREYYDRLGAGYYIRNVVRKMAGEHVILEVTSAKITSLDATEALNPLVLAAWKTVRRIPGL